MTELEDRRPVAAVTTRGTHPDDVGRMLKKLLTENPEIELTTIRLIPNQDGTVGIAGRIGELAGVECPQCHQPAGRPHTEYCTLSPDAVWTDLGCTCADLIGRTIPGPQHSAGCPMRIVADR